MWFPFYGGDELQSNVLVERYYMYYPSKRSTEGWYRPDDKKLAMRALKNPRVSEGPKVPQSRYRGPYGDPESFLTSRGALFLSLAVPCLKVKHWRVVHLYGTIWAQSHPFEKGKFLQ